MTKEDREYLQDRINEDGFYYTFESYSDFSEVEDKVFHELREQFLDAADKLKEYINSEPTTPKVEKVIHFGIPPTTL